MMQKKFNKFASQGKQRNQSDNDNKKKILMNFMKKFLKITEDNQGFKCFIYDFLWRKTNNYIYFPSYF